MPKSLNSENHTFTSRRLSDPSSSSSAHGLLILHHHIMLWGHQCLIHLCALWSALTFQICPSCWKLLLWHIQPFSSLHHCPTKHREQGEPQVGAQQSWSWGEQGSACQGQIKIMQQQKTSWTTVLLFFSISNTCYAWYFYFFHLCFVWNRAVLSVKPLLLLARFAADTKLMCSCCGFILLLNTFSPQATTQIYWQQDGVFKKLSILSKFQEKSQLNQPTNLPSNWHKTKQNQTKQTETNQNKNKKITHIHIQTYPLPKKEKRKQKTKSRLWQGRGWRSLECVTWTLKL